MSFYETLFPTDISYGSSGGPGFATTIVGLDTGAEQRVSRWSKARRKFDIAYGVKTYSQLQSVIEFYMSVKGAAYGFRYKDWTDFTTATDGRSAYTFGDVPLRTNTTGGNVPSGEFTCQMAKRYSVTQVDGSSTSVVVRDIVKPVKNSVAIGKKLEGSSTVVVIDESNWTVNTATGVVTINEEVLGSGGGTGTTIYGGCEFDVPVRFTKEMDDIMSMTLDTFDSGSMDSIELIEVTDHGEHLDEFFYGGSSTLTLTGNASLAYTQGRAVVLENTTGESVWLTLPDPQTSPPGGPYFFLLNVSAVNTINLSDSGSYGGGVAEQLAAELERDKGCTMWISEFEDGTRQWRFWSEA